MPIRRVVLFHGWGGPSDLHWQHWLKTELENRDIGCIAPAFPLPKNPLEDEWVETAFAQNSVWDESIALVGHSLGTPTIFRILERLGENQKVGLVVSVAGLGREVKGNSTMFPIRGFVDRPFDWQKIRRRAGEFIVIYSDDDPFIPVADSFFLAQQLGTKPVLEKNAGHISAGSGFGPYPRLLELILEKKN